MSEKFAVIVCRGTRSTLFAVNLTFEQTEGALKLAADRGYSTTNVGGVGRGGLIHESLMPKIVPMDSIQKIDDKTRRVKIDNGKVERAMSPWAGYGKEFREQQRNKRGRKRKPKRGGLKTSRPSFSKRSRKDS